MGETSAQKPTSGQQQCRVDNISGVFTARFFVSDAHCGHGCENDYTEHGHVKSQSCTRDVGRSRHMATGQSLSKMSKPTALHTEGTAQVSEWLNISDTAKKLY